MDNTSVLTTTPQAHSSNRSGQLMCYLKRSIQFVIDRTGRAVYLPLLNRSGLDRRVIEGGTIRPGDPVTPA